MLPLHQLVFLATSIAACGYAAVRGGAPERILGGGIFAAILSTWALSFLFRPDQGAYATMELAVAATDLALFGLMVAVALTSTRFWPILMAGMQGSGLLGHLAKPLGPDIIPKAYFAIVAFWGFPIVLLLAVATWRHGMRLRRYGVDYAWVHDLPRRYRQGWSIDELARPLPQG